MHKKIAAGIMLGLFASTNALAQRASINERVEFYGIQGRSAEQLVREMRTKSPPPAFGGPTYFARAETYFTWDLNLETLDDGSCGIEAFEVKVDVLYTLPKWTDKERGSKRLVQYWDEFEKNLFIHEQGHGDIALEIAVDMAQAIAKTESSEACKDLIDTASENANLVLKESRSRQREYDKETGHGKTQGAYFDIAAAKGRRRR